jgi:hypothetical protein
MRDVRVDFVRHHDVNCSIRIALALAALVILQGCILFPSEVGFHSIDYLNEGQREAWRARLAAESVVPPKTTFHPVGHLLATSGKFPIPDVSPSHVRAWLVSHRNMLGIPPHAQLTARDGDRQATLSQATADIATDMSTRTITYEVSYGGFPFTGLPIRVVVDQSMSAIRAVINGFSPPTRGFGDEKPSSEEGAWAAAEQHINDKLEHMGSVLTWFDKDWALFRVPGVKQLHWRLEGIDSQGARRYVFIRASDDSLSYATPARTYFEVPQTHQDDHGNVFWDSETLPEGCISESPGCTGHALAQSRISTVVFPHVVDVWYRLSSPLPGALFQWPFIGLHKGPYDHRLRSIRVIVGHDGSVCSLPCRDNGTYYFPAPKGTLVRHQYGLVGHEYGHALLLDLKLVHPGAASSTTSPPAQFTEAMADFIGIVSNFQIRLEKMGVSSEFSIGDSTAPRVHWELIEGSCPDQARERIGHAFYNAWVKIRTDLPGGSARPKSQEYKRLFRAWWLVIMSTFADLPDFPAIEDFSAALEGNPHHFVQDEAHAYFAVGSELERLGLSAGCR